MEVDHIDRNPKNNKLENLRLVTRQQNSINKLDHALKGVHYRKDRNKFSAQIKVNGIKTHLGNFDTAEEARAAYLSARKLADELLGYSK